VEDVKTFIESGILELYVLGDATPAERKQVEAMVQEHPAVKAELNEVERALESYAIDNAIEPSANQRNKILNSLVTNLADDSTFKTKETEATVVAMPASNNGNFYKYAFAASVALLIASVISIYNLTNKVKQQNEQLVAASLQNQRFSKTVDYMDDELNIFRDTSFKVLRLKGTKNLPTGGVLLAWNPVKQKVMLDLKSLDMPANDKDHQYQLWALVNGKPVDLGVFDKIDNDTLTIKEMKPVAAAQAFAVTREPRGGSVNPTMSEMMLIGQF
jgi:anti-sigma-K factor RskA